MNLQLSLTGKWFEMTDPNGKTEDYREITPYWASRLFNKHDKSMTFWFWKGYLGLTGIDGNRLNGGW